MSASPGGRRSAAREFNALENVDPIWSVRTAAAVVALSPKHLRLLVSRREGPAAIRIGRSLRFRRSAVEEWINSRTEAPSTATRCSQGGPHV
jgi:excisionase family DNA binding protein